ncbi:MAG: fumarylacetoacetase [Flavobacteriales bacterium]|nr:fumarylacetoacetase [Flavobacteriales bacterium]|tara:strand:+ start:10514 stop:11791 length:1278 start_codon:yes stop_codon:yes gene_type:complete
MNITANNPALKSWVEVDKSSDFPIQNLPFGIVKNKQLSARAASRIGDFAIDLFALFQLGYLDGLGFEQADFDNNRFNQLMKKGKDGTRMLRNRLAELFSTDNNTLQNKKEDQEKVLIPIAEIENEMPVHVGDYTDFYSSIEHATNVGTLFRDPENALLPNWKYIPVGYHGRASSIILSGEEIHRPKGQQKPKDDEPPVFGPCKLLDFELEMAFITYDGKPLGESISTKEADDFIFGMVLFNDWSARDIQKWEYVPLGPFLAKNFASSISAWIVTLDALEPFRVKGPEQDPKVFPYLEYQGEKNIDINLEVLIQPEEHDEASSICRSNYKYMYWNQTQQLAHHTINGCNIKAGDMYASGTISGPTEDSYGSMLELSWKGSKTVKLKGGEERKFIQDKDTVIMRGHCEKDGVRIGFGEVSTKVLPAK